MGLAKTNHICHAGKMGNVQRISQKIFWNRLSRTQVVIPFTGEETRAKIIRKEREKHRLPPREGETQ